MITFTDLPPSERCGRFPVIVTLRTPRRRPDLQEAVAQGIWPAVYLVMLTRSSVREWFASKPAAPGEMPSGEQ
jgi:hypothetical protein